MVTVGDGGGGADDSDPTKSNSGCELGRGRMKGGCAETSERTVDGEGSWAARVERGGTAGVEEVEAADVVGVRMRAAAVWASWDRGVRGRDGVVMGVGWEAGTREGEGGKGVGCSGVTGVMVRMVWRGGE